MLKVAKNRFVERLRLVVNGRGNALFEKDMKAKLLRDEVFTYSTDSDQITTETLLFAGQGVERASVLV